MVYKEYLTELKKIICDAGDEVAKIYKDYCNLDLELQVLTIKNKADHSPLTEADLASHRIIKSHLNKLTPHIPIVSEEGLPDGNYRDQDFWLIDPLDGTREFIEKNNQFTINIAYIHNHQAHFGLIYAPMTQELFWGGVGVPAEKCFANQTRPLSMVQEFDQKNIRIAVSKSHLDTKTEVFLAKIENKHLLSIGSSLKFCWIADGRADVYPRFANTSEWDTAAAQAILESAGGFVVDLLGQPLVYGKTEILNPHFIAAKNSLREFIMSLVHKDNTSLH